MRGRVLTEILREFKGALPGTGAPFRDVSKWDNGLMNYGAWIETVAPL